MFPPKEQSANKSRIKTQMIAEEKVTVTAKSDVKLCLEVLKVIRWNKRGLNLDIYQNRRMTPFNSLSQFLGLDI